MRNFFFGVVIGVVFYEGIVMSLQMGHNYIQNQIETIRQR